MGAMTSLMVSGLPAATARSQPPMHAAPPANVHVLCASDAATGAPVVYARVRMAGGRVWGMSGHCLALPVASGDTITITRLGYTPWTGTVADARGVSANTVTRVVLADTVAHGASADTVIVRLVPVAAALPASITRARGSSGASSVGARNAVTLDVDSARTLGAGSTGALIALLPYTFPRGARHEVSVSLRGARREQVAVTLDGLPLTDPATGLADLADVPLAALGAVTVAPGSDPVGTGPGAAGGVLALHTGTGSIASVRAGAFGETAAEGAWDGALGTARLRLGAAHHSARNDYPFVNRSGTTGTAIPERRVNNDMERTNLFTHLRSTRVHVTALVAHTEAGLVGPVNVRDYDEDRTATRRLFLRVTGQAGETLLAGGVRAFSLAYRDPARPQFDTDARVFAADLDARRVLAGALLIAGAGGDRLRTSSGITQDRARGHLSLSSARHVLGLDWTGGARLDVVSGGPALPSFSLAAERRGPAFDAGVRVAQAVRVPTLYDLWFSSPQRITVRALDAERVLLDAEVHARWRPVRATAWQVTGEGALVSRVTRHAIVWFPGNFGWSPANVGTERLYGVESRVAVTRAPVDLSAWSTVYRAELTSGALRIPTPYVPVVAGGAIARVARDRWQLSAVGRWLGPRPYTAGPRDPAFMLPAVSLLDLTGSVRRTMRGADLLFTLSLDNATDRAWQSVRGFPSPGRAWSVAFTIRP